MPDSAMWINASHEAGAVLPVVPEDGPVARRVVLFGPPGSGKTTAAGALGQRLGLPVLRLAPVRRTPGSPAPGSSNSRWLYRRCPQRGS
ncbi:AAA family ATPase [Streptomyces zhihengii]